MAWMSLQPTPPVWLWTGPLDLPESQFYHCELEVFMPMSANDLLNTSLSASTFTAGEFPDNNNIFLCGQRHQRWIPECGVEDLLFLPSLKHSSICDDCVPVTALKATTCPLVPRLCRGKVREQSKEKVTRFFLKLDVQIQDFYCHSM